MLNDFKITIKFINSQVFFDEYFKASVIGGDVNKKMRDYVNR